MNSMTWNIAEGLGQAKKCAAPCGVGAAQLRRVGRRSRTLLPVADVGWPGCLWVGSARLAGFPRGWLFVYVVRYVGRGMVRISLGWGCSHMLWYSSNE